MMKVLIFLTLFVAAFAAKSRYDNYKVLSLHVDTEEQYKAVLDLEGMGYLYMDPPHGVGFNADVIVPPHKFAEIDEIIERLNFKTKVMMENLQEAIDDEKIASRAADFGWTAYYPLANIYEWMQDQVAAYPGIVTSINLGTTYEGREIRGIKISYKAGNRAIFLEANIHAREWITSATATWIANHLLTSKDPAVRNAAETIDWYILPVANPDGFVYTHTSTRLWRKTRQPNTGTCIGADPNRNFGFHWMTGGASSSGCSETFAGTRPFSEPETAALVKFYESITDKVDGYLDLHSYSQLLMYPYGTTTAGNISNRGEHDTVGRAMQASLRQRHGTVYDFGNIVTTIYVASGGSIDYIKGVFDTPFVYVYELRDTGRHGFILPADQIIPNAEEVWDSFLTFIVEARKLGHLQ